jgi:MFS family permease
MNAIALNSSMYNASRMVGPAIAGLLVARIGEGWCFLANSFSYIAVIAGLLRMNMAARELPIVRTSPVTDVVEGFRFVWSNTRIRGLLTLIAVLSFLGLPFWALMPVFAADVLHGGAQTLGLLMSASGIGALAGALLLASRKTLSGLGRLVPVSAAAFAVSLLALCISRIVWLSAAIMVVVGFSMMLTMGASNTLIQSMSPDRLRGRVMSVYSMMFMGMTPAGSLIAGAAAERVGAPISVAVGGIACLAAAAIFWRHFAAITVSDLQGVNVNLE